jgi:ubiquinone/menaquinone biosynthesis C-methylase UbiE
MATKMATVKPHKTKALTTILKEFGLISANKILVIGCGSGMEAHVLSQNCNGQVFGIDIEDKFEFPNSDKLLLQVGDATQLHFPDNYFDFVYSYHSLEHIPDYQKALNEAQRVLSYQGGFMFGTPNRMRIIGSISSDGDIVTKIRANVADWKNKLHGKFRNEYGAHAGFSKNELKTMLLKTFPTATDISDNYYFELYKRYDSILKILIYFKFTDFLYPSIYFAGRNSMD